MNELELLKSELAASQQEARRLRKAIESQLPVNKEVNKLKVGNFYLPETMDGFLAFTSTPAPVHSDTERLNWLMNQGLCWRNADLHVDGWRIGHETEWLYNVGEGARKTIDAAIDAELAKEGK